MGAKRRKLRNDFDEQQRRFDAGFCLAIADAKWTKCGKKAANAQVCRGVLAWLKALRRCKACVRVMDAA